MSGKKKAVAGSSKPNAKGGVRAKPNPTRKSSRSPQPVRVKKEAGDDFGASSVQVVGGETLSDLTACDDEPQARKALASLRVKEGAGREGPSALGSRRVPKPYPVVYDGPVPRSIDDVDTPARLHQRRHCARLFDGTVKYDIDKDGLRECLLIELPELLPFDKERLLKWKASETQRIRDGKLSIEYDWDDRMTDEERKKVVECCSPADLEGMEAGRLRIYEDGFVEYVLGGVRFEVTEGTDVLDRQDVYWANMNEGSTDHAGNQCDISVYPMFAVKHRVVFSPMMDELI